MKLPTKRNIRALRIREIQEKNRRCPHIIRKRAGDESFDICELTTKSCLIEHGLYECEIWNDIKEEK